MSRWTNEAYSNVQKQLIHWLLYFGVTLEPSSFTDSLCCLLRCAIIIANQDTSKQRKSISLIELSTSKTGAWKFDLNRMIGVFTCSHSGHNMLYDHYDHMVIISWKSHNIKCIEQDLLVLLLRSSTIGRKTKGKRTPPVCMDSNFIRPWHSHVNPAWVSECVPFSSHRQIWFLYCGWTILISFIPGALFSLFFLLAVAVVLGSIVKPPLMNQTTKAKRDPTEERASIGEAFNRNQG